MICSRCTSRSLSSLSSSLFRSSPPVFVSSLFLSPNINGISRRMHGSESKDLYAEKMKESQEELKRLKERERIKSTRKLEAASRKMQNLLEVDDSEQQDPNQLAETLCCENVSDAFKKNHTDCVLNFWGLMTMYPDVRSEHFNVYKDTPLHVAVMWNNTEMVINLFRKGIDVLTTNSHLLTPLHLAMATTETNIEIIRFLLMKGPKAAKMENEYGLTPLHIAAKTGFISAVELLLPHSDVNARGGNGDTPLLLAALMGHKEVVEILLKHGAQTDLATNEKGTPINVAAVRGHVECAQLLLEAGADFTIADIQGSAPIHSACCKGSFEIAKMLVERGAKVNEADGEGMTSLMLASYAGNPDLVNYLLEKGADPLYTNYRNLMMPIHLACHSKSLATVQALLAKGASVTALNVKKENSMHYAAMGGDLSIVKAIIKKKKLTDTRNMDGETPLLLATKNNFTDIALALLEDGADANAIDIKSSGPLHHACIHGNEEVVKALLKFRANPNDLNVDHDSPLSLSLCRLSLSPPSFSSCALSVLNAGGEINVSNDKGHTPLHYAARHGLVKWVQLLLKKGAKKDAKDAKGRTPYDLAKINHRVQCAKLLKVEKVVVVKEEVNT